MAVFANSLPNEIVPGTTKGSPAVGLSEQPSVVTQTQEALGIPPGAQQSGVSSPIPATLREAEQSLSVNENIPEAQYLDSQVWKIFVTATNHSPPVRPVAIPSNYIHELVLEHSIIDPCFFKGSMIVTSNRYGILEGDSPDDNINLEMLFRGDGKDELLIEIKPLFADQELPPEMWEIRSEFIIYDVEEIPWNNQTLTAKKIYFWHKAYNKMIEKSLGFSTALFVDRTQLQNKSNVDRSISVGLAIQKLLEQAGMQQYIDYEEWDIGEETAKIFFTAPTSATVLESIQYLLQYYISSGNCPGLFYFNRGKNKFQLVCIKKIFNNAGVNEPGIMYYETYRVGTGYADSDTNISPNKTPVFNFSKFDYAIEMKKYNLIQDNSYRLTDLGGADSIESFISTPVHTYNAKDKVFNVFYKDSEIKQFKSYFKKEFTDKLLPGSSGDSLLVLNSSKKQQERVDSKFVSSNNKSIDLIATFGRNLLTLRSIFLNLGINFRVQGSTHRHAGRFIGLDKNKNSDNKYDFRLLGQWFVTSVITRWQGNELYNEVTANKVSSFQNLRFNEDA